MSKKLQIGVFGAGRGEIMIRVLLNHPDAEPVSYTHLDVYKRQAIGREQVIRVGYPIQKGLTEVDASGQYSGYTYDYLEEIAQYTGWDYEFVQVPGDINTALSTMMETVSYTHLLILAGIILSNFSNQKINFKQIAMCIAVFVLNGFVSIISKLHQIESDFETINACLLYTSPFHRI